MNKIILVTGSSSGFGKLIAQSLAKAGHTVYASMRNIQNQNSENAINLQHWAVDNKCDLKVIELDVCKPGDPEKVINEIISKQGILDVLVNNAGHGSMGLTEDFTDEYVRMQFETNVFGVFNVTKAAIPVMKNENSGLIVTISSGLGRFVIPTLHVYSASKFAVEALAEGWRYELAPLGIDSIIIEPGAYPTTNFVQAAYAHSPQPSSKINDYRGLKEFVQVFGENLQESVKNGTANNPQNVAEAISRLVNTPFGSRPLRTVIDPMSEKFLNSLNRTTDDFETNMLRSYQLA
jgi:NAD(P)-dependent dehydrogenase (short-subunit alcohol dehydrogenase family)